MQRHGCTCGTVKGQEARGESQDEADLDMAQASVFAKGFGATSIDEIIAARALLQRFLDTEEAILNDVFGRARKLHDFSGNEEIKGLV